MKFMNKTITTLSLVFVLMIASTGCGSSSASATETAEESTAVETSAVSSADNDTPAAEEATEDPSEPAIPDAAAAEAAAENATQADETLAEESDGTLTAVINAGDVDDYGYWHQQATVTGTYSFQPTGDKNTEWQVVVMAEEFTDAERYIPQAYKTMMTCPGTVQVESGSWFYVYCSANDWTGDTAEDGCACTLTIVPTEN